MMKTLKLLILIVVLVISCQSQQAPNWPQYVMSSLWVPNNARDVRYYRMADSYQVKYRVDERYPGKIFIKEMINNMNQRGWQRLDYDFLNPKIKASHIKTADGAWDSYVDVDGTTVAQWIDDWQDTGKNHIRYGLSYRGKNGFSANTSNLEVFAIFITAESVKKQ